MYKPALYLTPKGLEYYLHISNPVVQMQRSLQSLTKNIHEATGRTIGSPLLFSAFPDEIKTALLQTAILRSFSDGQIIQHHGDSATGFWVIDTGQIKLGRFQDNGDLQTILILGEGDSFGELACLGGFDRVVDVVSVGKTRMHWISEASFFTELSRSPVTMREVLRIFARQVQESFDNVIAARKLSAKKQLARALVALCRSRALPVNLTIRHNELAELIGVSRVTIGSILSELERDGLLERRYRKLIIPDPDALTEWMRAN